MKHVGRASSDGMRLSNHKRMTWVPGVAFSTNTLKYFNTDWIMNVIVSLGLLFEALFRLIFAFKLLTEEGKLSV